MKNFFKTIKKMTMALGLSVFLCAGSAYADMPPAKQIIIYNNTRVNIYPVIEVSPHISKNVSTHSTLYRVYVNPALSADTSGIKPGHSVTLTVPFYTPLASDPAQTYIDWWKGGQVYIYDNYDVFAAHYQKDTRNPSGGVPVKSVITCDPASVCGNLTAYSATEDFSQTEPFQRVDYTFGDIDKNNTAMVSQNFNAADVNYTISYANHLYLPVAVEPLDNPSIGYIGTVQTRADFRNGVKDFRMPGNIIPQKGNGIIITVGGSKGLTDTAAFDPSAKQITGPLITDAWRDPPAPNKPKNIIVTFTRAQGSSFTYVFMVNGSEWQNVTGDDPATLLDVGLGKADIVVNAKDQNDPNKQIYPSNVWTVPSAFPPLNPPSIPLTNGAYPRKTEPTTVVVNYTPASGGDGNITYTAIVNGGVWTTVKNISPTQMYLTRAINGAPITVQLIAKDTSGNSASSNSVTVKPSPPG